MLPRIRAQQAVSTSNSTISSLPSWTNSGLIEVLVSNRTTVAIAVDRLISVAGRSSRAGQRDQAAERRGSEGDVGSRYRERRQVSEASLNPLLDEVPR